MYAIVSVCLCSQDTTAELVFVALHSSMLYNYAGIAGLIAGVLQGLCAGRCIRTGQRGLRRQKAEADQTKGRG